MQPLPAGWRLHASPDLTPLESVWRRAAAAGGASIFQSWTFAQHWAAVFAHEVEFQIIHRDSPAAVLPFVRRGGNTTLLGEGLFDYLDFIGTPEATGVVPLALPLHVTGVPERSGWRAAWLAFGATAQPFAAAPLRSPAAGREALDAEHRRVVHRWQAAQVSLHRETEPHPRRQLLDWLLERKLAQAGDACVLGAFEQAWIRRMVEHAPQLAELWHLERVGRTAAALLCWRSEATRYAYTIAYDPDLAPISPGILALFGVLRHTMTEGRTFNFLIGEHSFKQRFATDRDPLLIFHAD